MRLSLTDREKAVLTYAVTENIEDWRFLYMLASDKSVTSIKKRSDDNIGASASTWKNNPSVKSYYLAKKVEYEGRLKQMIETERQKWINADESEKAKIISESDTNMKIDFTDREQFMRFINKQLNEVEEEKDRQTYLKMISDNMRFKEDKPEKGDVDIMRFYVPLTCKDCALYKRAQGIVDDDDDEEEDDD